jgi:hypothetical protein
MRCVACIDAVTAGGTRRTSSSHEPVLAPKRMSVFPDHGAFVFCGGKSASAIGSNFSRVGVGTMTIVCNSGDWAVLVDYGVLCCEVLCGCAEWCTCPGVFQSTVVLWLCGSVPV